MDATPQFPIPSQQALYGTTAMPYILHTIIETPVYLKHVCDNGLTAEEQEKIAFQVAANPLAGDLIPGTGGARKLRISGIRQR
jgi:hypothetical protein